jgi:CelD/BcsL family acetyltransferase involved in cellulose biosynthesis
VSSPNAPRLAAVAWHGLSGLAAIAPAWESIMDGAEGDPLCNGPDWCLAYARAFCAEEDPFGWLVKGERDEPVAVLPFRMEPPRGLGRLRRALHLADGSFDSDYLDLPHRGISAEATVDKALELLATERRVQAVVLACIPKQSPTLEALRAALDRRALRRREVEVPCLAARLPSTFEDYLKSLKPRVRSKVRQALRLAESAGAAFKWCADAPSLARHLDGLFTLHAMRWNSIGGTGCFTDSRRREFYRGLGPAFLAKGRLRFGRAEIAGEAVAYQFGVLAGGAYYQLQEGFDPRFEKQRIGTALRAWMIGRLVEEGVRRYDFMAGESQHKDEWGAAENSGVTVSFALPRVRARVAYALRSAVERLRLGGAAPRRERLSTGEGD